MLSICNCALNLLVPYAMELFILCWRGCIYINHVVDWCMWSVTGLQQAEEGRDHYCHSAWLCFFCKTKETRKYLVQFIPATDVHVRHLENEECPSSGYIINLPTLCLHTLFHIQFYTSQHHKGCRLWAASLAI